MTGGQTNFLSLCGRMNGQGERVVVSHISRKTSEMWGTRHLLVI